MITRTLLILSALLAIAGRVVADDTPMLSYQWSGGHSPYKRVSVVIYPSGSAAVEGEKHTSPPVDYRAQLSPGEVAHIRSLIRGTDFFNQSDRDSRPALHTGQSVMTAHLDGRSRTLKYRANPALEPLTRPLWKLVTQAFAIRDIEKNRDIYHATNVVRKNSSGPKVLQPYAFREPLQTYIVNHEERQNVQWALEALAWVTTPEEYSGFIARGIEDGQSRHVLLELVGSHPFHGNIPKAHFRSLCPVYLSFVRDVGSGLSEAGSLEKEAMAEFADALGDARCESAIPFFKEWFEEHDKPYVDGSFMPLAMMGKASLNALVPYLDSPKEAHRMNAAELLGMVSQFRPGRYAHFMTDYEYGAMVPVFKRAVLPRLSELAKDDASARVREKAGEAIEVINREIKAHRSLADE